MTCPSCGAENPASARFCNQCGSPVPAAEPAPTPAPPAAERRQLTVMFCDLAGSTALAQALDPEDLREVMQAYQSTCEGVITRYEGTIAQYLGDGILAYFGYPMAHEDAAQRAVRAGLAIVDGIRSLNATGRLPSPRPIAVRVGIHTGLVVVSDVGSGARQERLALGDTPNIAARLEGLAAENQVLVTRATHALTSGFFDVDSLGPRELKGVTEPVEVLAVLRPSGIRHALQSTSGVTPYVGREDDLSTLDAAWQRVVQGRGRALLIQGEAGMGKSRLIPSFRQRLDQESYVFRDAYCSPFYRNTPLYPVAEQFRTFIGPHQGEEALRRLRQLLRQLDVRDDESTALLARLLSIPTEETLGRLDLSPQAQRRRTIELVRDLLLGLTKDAPVMVLVEDLHWADPSTLELIDHLVPAVADRRMLLVLTARPSFEPPWPTDGPVARLTLSRLPSEESEQIVHAVSGDRRLAPEVVQLLIGKTEGIPLFIEEMTKSVVESDSLVERDGRLHLAGAVSSVAIPATLQDSLMARLDRMEGAKDVAQVGSCIGREFGHALLERVCPAPVTLDSGLDRLVDAELLFREGTAPDTHYTFKHALIQDAAYDSLLKRTRQQYHARIAEILETDFPVLVTTEPELIAHHYEKAARPAQAVGYWLTAGQRAVAASANAEAVGHLKAGLALVQALPDEADRVRQELDLRSTLGIALSNLQGYASEEVQKTFARAQELCAHAGETPRLFWVLWGLWAFHLVRGEHHAALDFGTRLMEEADRRRDDGLLADARFSVGLTNFFMGDVRPALDHMDAVIALYDPERHHANAFLTGQDVGVTARAVAGLARFNLGEIGRARQHATAAIDLAVDLEHRYSEAYALGCASWLHVYLQEPERVHHFARRAVALSETQGFVWWLTWGTLLDGWARMRDGAIDEGLAQMQTGLTNWRATGSGFTIPYFLSLEAEGALAAGRHDDARQRLEEAATLIETQDERLFESRVRRLQAEVRLDQAGPDAGDDLLDEVEAGLRQALDIARRQRAASVALRAALRLSDLWNRRGRTDEARGLLADAIQAMPPDESDAVDTVEATTRLAALGASS